MTTYYVDSAAGSNTNPYNSWATAATTMAPVATLSAAGDVIYVASTHNESTGSAVTHTFGSTAANPVRIICADKTSGAPPATAATGGAIKTAGGSSYQINAVGLYCYGITFQTGDGTGSCYAQLGGNGSNSRQVFDACTFYLNSNNSGNGFYIGNNQASEFYRFNGCGFKFANTGARIFVASSTVEIDGGSIATGSGAITTFMTGSNSARGFTVNVSGFDMTNGAAALALYTANSFQAYKVMFRDCKVPASFTLTTSAVDPGGRVTGHNIDSGSTNYRTWVEDYAGTVREETTIVRSGGASDGTTSLSWKMSSNANALFTNNVFRSDEIVQWNDTTGSSKTATVEFIHDTNVAAGQGAGASFAFQNNEVWLELMYLSAAGTPLGSWVSSGIATPLTTATDDTSSSATWTTTGLTTPVKQKLSVTFTPQKKGFVIARVCIGKASKTIYVDPLLTIV